MHTLYVKHHLRWLVAVNGTLRTMIKSLYSSRYAWDPSVTRNPGVRLHFWVSIRGDRVPEPLKRRSWILHAAAQALAVALTFLRISGHAGVWLLVFIIVPHWSPSFMYGNSLPIKLRARATNVSNTLCFSILREDIVERAFSTSASISVGTFYETQPYPLQMRARCMGRYLAQYFESASSLLHNEGTVRFV